MREKKNKIVGQAKKWNLKFFVYADDIMPWGFSKNHLEQNLKMWNDIANDFELQINMEKIVAMLIARDSTNDCNIKIDGTILSKVEKFCYLGLKINTSGKIKNEIRRRIYNFCCHHYMDVYHPNSAPN